MSETTHYADIFGYIQSQETMFKKGIRINENWVWSMYDHVRLSTLYKNSQLSRGKNDYTPVKNITRPILNVQYRAEGFDVKDIQLYIDDAKTYFKSFLVKKYHEKWALDNHMDTFIDELVESYVDFGGALIKDVDDVKPEVVQLASIAFCDQTDILSGPIAIKHFFSPDQLLAMADKGWGDKSKGATITLEGLIKLSREQKKDDNGGTLADTPGRYIEIYEVHGNLPKRFADLNSNSESYETRLFICAFYQQEGGKRAGVILYTGKEKDSPFKFIKRDPVFGRALGFGGAEELFEPQVWVNYNMIRMQDMLDAAAKTILLTQDATLAAKHPKGLRDIDNLELLKEGAEGNTRQLDTYPRNLKVFENAVQQWEMHAQQMGAANDAIMGEQPAAGTPFKLQELVTAEGHSLHEYRKGKIATFLQEVYADWVIPHIVREITKGQEFLAELDMDELQYVADSLVECQTNNLLKEKILNGEQIDPQQIELFKGKVRDTFKGKGNKHFIEIFKDEMKDAPVSVRVNIVGKQKNLAASVDKLVNIFRFAFSNPQGFAAVMQIPGMAKAFNQIIEFSGLSPVDFAGIEKLALPAPATAPAGAQPSPLTPQMVQPQAAQAY